MSQLSYADVSVVASRSKRKFALAESREAAWLPVSESWAFLEAKRAAPRLYVSVRGGLKALVSRAHRFSERRACGTRSDESQPVAELADGPPRRHNPMAVMTQVL